MNNYYKQPVYTNFSNAIDLLQQILSSKVKVKFTGKVVNFTNSFSVFTLGLENGKSIKVKLDKAPSEFARYKIRENSIVTIEGFLTVFQSEKLSPMIQLQGTFITIEENPKDFHYTKFFTKKIVKIDNIAVISNENSRGYNDFIGGLNKGLKKPGDEKYQLFNVALEGDEAVKNIVETIEKINYEATADLICIVRGGGEKYSLQYVFDNIKVCNAVLDSSIPVLVGIGHDLDNYLLIDEVADSPYDKNGKRHYSGTPAKLANTVNYIYHNLKRKSDIITSGAIELNIDQLYEGVADELIQDENEIVSKDQPYQYLPPAYPIMPLEKIGIICDAKSDNNIKFLNIISPIPYHQFFTNFDITSITSTIELINKSYASEIDLICIIKDNNCENLKCIFSNSSVYDAIKQSRIPVIFGISRCNDISEDKYNLLSLSYEPEQLAQHLKFNYYYLNTMLNQDAINPTTQINGPTEVETKEDVFTQSGTNKPNYNPLLLLLVIILLVLYIYQLI